MYMCVLHTMYKDFPKERYNTYAKSCNSNVYTKYPGATYRWHTLCIHSVYTVRNKWYNIDYKMV